MPTVPTGRLERELRALYLRWVAGLQFDSSNLDAKIAAFQRQSQELIERLGGRAASLGSIPGFPAPKRLDLSPYPGTAYNEMQTAAIQASITAGTSSKTAAQAMFRAGMDKSYRQLEKLARTETVRAYWKNAWDSIEDLPELVMLWGAENGPRTCPWCLERDGLVLESSLIRDHPYGRCTPIPTLRSRVEYRGSVASDGTIYQDRSWGRSTATGFQGGRAGGRRS